MLIYLSEDGKIYQVDYYNLDVIISVDYKLKYTVSLLKREQVYKRQYASKQQ